MTKRAAITDFLVSNFNGHCFDRDYAHFCWNVKLRRLDLSFDNLMAVYRKWEDSRLTDPATVEKCRQVYDQKHGDDTEGLYEIAVELACEHVVESNDTADSYKTLWFGGDIRPVLRFGGRSGGWIYLESFNGHNLLDAHEDDIRDVLNEMDWHTLKLLYAFVVMCNADFADPDTEVEIQAACQFFGSALNELESNSECAAAMHL